MTDSSTIEAYMQKAVESLATAESELSNHRYNSCANRCYYACFQAAVSALLGESIRPTSRSGQWSHDFVQAQFAGVLVRRRKLYPSELRTVLSELQLLRHTADYDPDPVTAAEARRSFRQSQAFVAAVRRRGGNLS